MRLGLLRRALHRRRYGRRARRAAALAALAAVAVVALVALGGDGGDGGELASEPGTTAATGPVERRVQFDGAGDITIAGTLSLPEVATTESPVAAVVVIPGFGPTTRDGVGRAGSAPDILYRDLGSRLVADGMSTLRYDKRGPGQSLVPPHRPLAFDPM
ncbi:MAG: lysophospholipase, partial [Actinobacteria bacterium]|nr:lysophospholipase [Actinomycetota bacterium]